MTFNPCKVRLILTSHRSEILCYLIITARKRSLGQSNVFRGVCDSVHSEGAWSWGMPGPEGVPGPRRGLVPACLEGSQAHNQGGSLGGSGWGGSPGPHPRGELRGIWSRPTYPPAMTTTAAGGTHPSGMHSCLYFQFSARSATFCRGL